MGIGARRPAGCSAQWVSWLLGDQEARELAFLGACWVVLIPQCRRRTASALGAGEGAAVGYEKVDVGERPGIETGAWETLVSMEDYPGQREEGRDLLDLCAKPKVCSAVGGTVRALDAAGDGEPYC